jgi:hypothetical protein
MRTNNQIKAACDKCYNLMKDSKYIGTQKDIIEHYMWLLYNELDLYP